LTRSRRRWKRNMRADKPRGGSRGADKPSEIP
jgi:hypothetical protein